MSDMIAERQATSKVVRATRIHGSQTVSFAGLEDGRSVLIDNDEYEALAAALRPVSFHETAGWVDEVCAVRAIDWTVGEVGR